MDTWLTLATELEKRQPAYVHLSHQLTIGGMEMPTEFPPAFCKAYTGTLMAAGGFTQSTATHAIEDDQLDLVAFGKPFIANPDLVERMQNGWPIAEAPVQPSMAGKNERGYTDFAK